MKDLSNGSGPVKEQCVIMALSKLTKHAIISLVVVFWHVGGVGFAQGASPTESVKGSINEVIRILKDESLKKPDKADERRRLLEKTVGERFSYEEMSKRSLGAQWQSLNEKERQEFVELFQEFLTNSYADRITGYSGEQVQYLGERIEQSFAEVRTKVVSGKTEIPLDYRMMNKSGDWRVYDVVIDGVSLVNNYRGQFSKIIRTSSYADLVEKLKKKSAKISSPAP
jgi:phospholipid transport system substrate-binding protein